MAKKNKTTKANPEWLSTYGILTAERILERFNIRISHDELMTTLKDPESRYYHLLSMPLKNIFNGILVNQVYDYQVYAQKLLIDYKLSMTEKLDDDESTGTNAEVELTTKQKDLMHLGEEFEEKKQAHRHLIADSQAWLIQEAPKEETLASSPEMTEFTERVEDLMLGFQNFLTEFRTLILDITSLLNVVPDYFMDEDKMHANQGSLGFDPNLSEVAESDSY